MSSGESITFGTALLDEGNAPLRERVYDLLAERLIGTLHVDSILASYARLARKDYCPAPPATNYLLLDWHRFLIYGECAGEHAPTVGSVIYHVVDAYPFKPLASLLGETAAVPFRFLYSLESLEPLPFLLSNRRPGIVLVGDFLTAAIGHFAAHHHPYLADGRDRYRESGPAVRAKPRVPDDLQDRFTDESLRSTARVDVAALISQDVGIIRHEEHRMNVASIPETSTTIQRRAGERTDHSYGMNFLPSAAAAIASCEALERFQIAFRESTEDLVYGSYLQLSEGYGYRLVDPSTLFFESTAVVRQLTATRPLGEIPMHWTWAHCLTDGGPVLVPAQDVWFDTSRLLGEPQLVFPTTSGCAFAASKEEAGIFALFEAIERDAFLTTWYLKRPCAQLDLDSIDFPPFQLLLRRWRASFSSYELRLFDMTTDIAVPSIVGIAIRRDGGGPRSFHAAATHVSAERACFGVLKDLTGFTPALLSEERRNELTPLLHHPELINGPEGHFQLFALDESIEQLRFQIEQSSAPVDIRACADRWWVPSQSRYNIRRVMSTLVERLQDVGIATIVKDLSHDSLGYRHGHCVRVIAPGLYPLWFGESARRFAVTDRLRRLGRKLVGRDYCDSEYNIAAHPLT